jgi:hypothetical protein
MPGEAFAKSYSNIQPVRARVGLAQDRAGFHQEFSFHNDDEVIENMMSMASPNHGILTLDLRKPAPLAADGIDRSFGRGKKKPRKPSLEKEGSQPIGVNCANWFFHGLYRDVDKYLKSQPGSPEAVAMAEGLRAAHRTPVEIGQRVIKTRYAQPSNLTTDGLPIGFVVEEELDGLE